MSHAYRFTRLFDPHPAHRRRSLSRRVRRLALALLNNFPETILLSLGFGMMTIVLIMSKFATWSPQFTN